MKKNKIKKCLDGFKFVIRKKKVFSRTEHSINSMYQKYDLNKSPLFAGNYINWGLYNKIYLNKKISKKERKKASERLYDFCSNFLDLYPEDSFLEIGTGKGAGLLYLSQKNSLKNVTALDQSLLYCKETKKKIPYGKIFHKNAETFSFDCSFNKILSIEAAQHFSNIWLFLENVYDHLDEGGTFVLSTFFGLKKNAKNILKNTIQTIDKEIDHLHNIKDIEIKMKTLGFTVEIISIGAKIFFGFDKWVSQTKMCNSWTRNWLKAYQENLIDYFVIKAYKNKKEKLLCNY